MPPRNYPPPPPAHPVAVRYCSASRSRAAGKVQAIMARGQSQLWLMLIFVGHLGQIPSIHIGWVAHYQVKSPTDPSYQTGQTQLRSPCRPHHVSSDIGSRSLARASGANIAQHHLGLLKGIGAGDAYAATASAQIQDTMAGCTPHTRAGNRCKSAPPVATEG